MVLSHELKFSDRSFSEKVLEGYCGGFFLPFIMAASFFHDESRLDEFVRRAQERSEREHRALLGPEECEVDVLEWPPSKCALFFFFSFLPHSIH